MLKKTIIISNDDVYYSRKQAAEYMNVSIRTLDNLIKTGQLKAARVGLPESKCPRVILSRTAIEKYLQEKTR